MLTVFWANFVVIDDLLRGKGSVGGRGATSPAQRLRGMLGVAVCPGTVLQAGVSGGGRPLAALAKATGGNTELVQRFALFHGPRRVNEVTDHPARRNSPCASCLSWSANNLRTSDRTHPSQIDRASLAVARSRSWTCQYSIRFAQAGNCSTIMAWCSALLTATTRSAASRSASVSWMADTP
jgi:hypothetical protein